MEIQALVKEIGEGDELSSNEATFSAYSFSLSLRKRGNGGCTSSTVVYFAEGGNGNPQ